MRLPPQCINSDSIVPPTITSIVPDSFVVSTPGPHNFSIFGTGFVEGAKVLWGLTPMVETFVSDTQIDSTYGSYGQVDSWLITVTNPDGGRSNGLPYSVVPA